MRNVLIIAPHADDEVLGCGATMFKYSQQGDSVIVLIMTNASKSDPRLFSPEGITMVRKEAVSAHKILGVSKTLFLDFPAPALDQVPVYLMANEIKKVLIEYRVDVLFVPHRGDIHIDHKMVFDAALVAARPVGNYTVKRILAYETLSETEWAHPFPNDAFIPTVFHRCTEKEINMKMEAMNCYKSQIRCFPSSRSLVTIDALSKIRGATISFPAAEAFILIREIE